MTKLTPPERNLLVYVAKNDRQALARQRAQAILLLDEGKNPREAADVLGVSLASIYNWNARWESGGLEILLPGKSISEYAQLRAQSDAALRQSAPPAGSMPLASRYEPPRLSCPHLGLDTDEQSNFVFAHEDHRCYRVKPGSPPTSAHQSAFCLSENYPNCPLLQNDGSSQAANVFIKPASKSNLWVRYAAGFIILVLVGVLSVGIVLQAVYPSGASFALWQETVTPQQTSTSVVAALAATRAYQTQQVSLMREATAQALTSAQLLLPEPSQTPTAAPSITPTNSPTPSPSPTSTPTGVPPTPVPATLTPGPIQGTPFGPDNRYLVHVVEAGESFAGLAVQFDTSTAVLEWVNPRPLGGAIRAGTAIVVLPGVKDAAGLPQLGVRFIEDSSSLAVLADAFGVTVDVLIEYNLLSAQTTEVQNRWMIAPVP